MVQRRYLPLALAILVAGSFVVTWTLAASAQSQTVAPYRTTSITPERLRALIDLALTNPNRTTIPWWMAVPLGLAEPGSPLPKFRAINVPRDHITYQLAADPADPRQVIVSRLGGGEGLIFSSNPVGELVLGAHVRSSSPEGPTTITMLDGSEPSVQASFNAVMAELAGAPIRLPKDTRSLEPDRATLP